MSVQGLVLLEDKGSPLSHAEMDGNFKALRDAINALQRLNGVSINPDGSIKNGAIGTAQLADGAVTLAKLASDAKLLPGTVLLFSVSTTVPDGWLECTGAAVSRTTYSDLFTAIGTLYGVGDGSSTFNLPDLSKRVPVGLGSGYSLGQKFGADNITLQASNIPPLQGTITTNDYDASPISMGDNILSDAAGSGTNNTKSVTVNEFVTPAPLDNRQPSTVLRFLIKT